VVRTLRRFETRSLAIEPRELKPSLCLFAPSVKLARPVASATFPQSAALLSVRGLYRLARI